MRIRAAVLRHPDNPVEVELVELDPPKAGEVLVRVAAAGVCHSDVRLADGELGDAKWPAVMGHEGAGVVEAVGDGVADLRPGDRVAYAGPIGGYAEVRLIDADRLVSLPDSISTEQAAAMMLQGMTARMLLRSVYSVQPGVTILVHAAAGGVGLILCQWAAALGATVIGTVSTEEKAELARANGCDHPILYTSQDFVAEVDRITQGDKVRVVYDSVGADTFLRSLDCLRPRGLMVSYGNASGPVEPFSTLLLAQKGSLFLTRPTLFSYIAARDELEQNAAELFAMVEGGKVRIDIRQRFALRDAAEAHRALEGRRTTGSTILTI